MRTCVAFCLVMACTTFAAACLWDYDTLREERARFPNALELITGKFIRHSREFYEWRIEDRTERLEQEPNNLALYDDLAVAYDKIGKHQQAINTMIRKDAITPGLYETQANLGTFHIHSGDLEEGLKHIEKAIEINPDAHFGRELYQALLVKYVTKYRTEEGIKLPLYKYSDTAYWSSDLVYLSESQPSGFAAFVTEAVGLRGSDPAALEAKRAELERAAKGVMGMMRFGNYDSPILLEALGMILVSNIADHEDDAKQLAARAFLRAAAVSKDDQVKADYELLAKSALTMQLVPGSNTDEMPLSDVQSQLAEEVSDAEQWFESTIVTDEKQWIADGSDVEALFDAKYRTEPSLPYRYEPKVIRTNTLLGWAFAVVIFVIALVLIATALSVKRWWDNQRAA